MREVFLLCKLSFSLVELLLILTLTTSDGSDVTPRGWQFGKSVTECNRYMLDNQLSTDVSFEVGPPDGARSLIRAHRYVLMSRSAIFEAMLFGRQRVDGQQNRLSSTVAADATIQIPEMDPGVFKEMLNFIYTDNATISLANVLPLMHAGKKYHLPKLISECQRVLQTNISSDNVCIILDQAIIFEEFELINKSIQFIGRHTRSVLASNAFKGLSREGLRYILSYDALLARETQLFQASLMWARNKLKLNQSVTENSTELSIRQTLGDVFYRIRFPTMTLQDFADQAGSSDLLTCSEKSSIYYYMVTGNHDALTFDWKNRNFESSVARFTSTVISQWASSQPEAIQFSTDKNITLTAIGTFPLSYAQYSSGAFVILTVDEQVPNSRYPFNQYNNFQQLNVGGTAAFKVNSSSSSDTIQKIPLDKEIDIKAGKKYVVKISMQNGGYGYYISYGQGGLSTVKKDDITFTFENAALQQGTQTNYDRGQIPRLYYMA